MRGFYLAYPTGLFSSGVCVIVTPYFYIISRILPSDLTKVSGCDKTTAQICFSDTGSLSQR